MAWTENNKGFVKHSIITLSELRQEIHRLKQNRAFIRNLCLTLIAIIASSLSAAEISDSNFDFMSKYSTKRLRIFLEKRVSETSSMRTLMIRKEPIK